LKTIVPLRWADAPDVLTVKEAASLIRVSRNAIYGAIESGTLPAANFGQRQIRISKDVLRQVFAPAQEHVPGTAAFGRNPGGN
jgi:excisionase family DNA binding protein